MQLTPIGSNMTEVETDDARILFSYRTPVAAFIHGTGYVKTEKYWSTTTSRHINKWMGKDISDTCAKIPQAELDVLAWTRIPKRWALLAASFIRYRAAMTELIVLVLLLKGIKILDKKLNFR